MIDTLARLSSITRNIQAQEEKIGPSTGNLSVNTTQKKLSSRYHPEAHHIPELHQVIQAQVTANAVKLPSIYNFDSLNFDFTEKTVASPFIHQQRQPSPQATMSSFAVYVSTASKQLENARHHSVHNSMIREVDGDDEIRSHKKAHRRGHKTSMSHYHDEELSRYATT